DLPGQVAVGHGGGHRGDVAHLAGQVGRHEVDVIRQVLPRAGHALDVGLSAELALRADLAGHARHLRGGRPPLVGHRVDGVLQLEDLSTNVDGDLPGQVAVGHGGGDVGDVAHLAGQVGRHEVDGVGEVLPGAGDALDVGLPAQPAFRTHLAGHAGDLGG